MKKSVTCVTRHIHTRTHAFTHAPMLYIRTYVYIQKKKSYFNSRLISYHGDIRKYVACKAQLYLPIQIWRDILIRERIIIWNRKAARWVRANLKVSDVGVGGGHVEITIANKTIEYIDDKEADFNCEIL